PLRSRPEEALRREADQEDDARGPPQEHARGAHHRSHALFCMGEREARRDRPDRQRARPRTAHRRARRRSGRHRHHEELKMERRKIHSTLADSPLTGAEHLDYSPVAMMPDVKVLKIGGQSVMDRGRSTVMAPFGYWEKPTKGGRIPEHRTAAGVFLTAEVLGSKRAIFVKDEDGLFTDDPKKNPKAEHIPRISAKELLARDLPDLVVERVVLEYLGRSRFCTELQIVNGLKKGELTRALAGEDVGTIIHR